jgi:hypothetical protein
MRRANDSQGGCAFCSTYMTRSTAPCDYVVGAVGFSGSGAPRALQTGLVEKIVTRRERNISDGARPYAFWNALE